jgi:superfamily II DNA helicase RecQ
MPLSNFFEFLFFYALWQKINQTNSILKGLWRSLDTRRWKNNKTSHVFKSLFLTAKDVFAVLLTGFGKSLIHQVLPALFSELHRLLRGTIENFVVPVVSPLEYIRVQHVETLRRLGIQAVHRTD